MTADGAILKRAREAAALSPSVAAALARVDEASLAAMEAGTSRVSPQVLDTFAKAFGLSLTELLQGQAPDTAPSLLFRSFRDSGPSLQALAESGALTTLGDFVRCVRALADVRAKLGVRSAVLEKLDRLATPEAPVADGVLARAERLALSVRAQLGLGEAPVPSMLRIYEQLGVDLFFVSPEELDVEVDAASTVTPSPAVLVNLVGGAEQWWRTRMTLAHELCHLLLDRTFFDAGSTFVMFSPSTERAVRSASGVRLPPPLELLEKRARAFAIHFLIPRPELVRVLAHRDPRSEAAVTAVCQHFQVGRIAAVNQLRNVQLITEDDRTRALGRHPASVLQANHPDAKVGRPGLRGALLSEVVMRAVAEGKVSPVKARSYLEVSAAASLPKAPGLDPKKRAPLVTMLHRVERAVLARLASDEKLADCCVDTIEAEGDTWRVEIAQAGAELDAPTTSRGFVVVGPDLQILEEHLAPRSGP